MDIQELLAAYEQPGDETATVIHRAGFLLGIAMGSRSSLSDTERLAVARAAGNLANYAASLEHAAAAREEEPV